MGSPKAVINSRLLNTPLAERCRATDPVESRSAPCRAVFGDGWEWHSCAITPALQHTAHRCPCGHRWTESDHQRRTPGL